MYKNAKKIAIVSVSTLVAGQNVIPVLANEKNENTTVDLRVLATTDLHANIMDHDYYTDKPNQQFGISKVSTLISQAKSEIDKNSNLNDKIDNTILVDNGDTIQGNPLATVYAMNEETKTKPGEKYPVYEALDLLKFDAINLGNHEFNYGLNFIKQITDKSVMNTTAISSNIFDNEGNNIFTPYKIVNEEVIDSNGNKQIIKIGITGFVPPQILNWDKQHLDGKVKVEDIISSAKKLTKKLKEDEQVDIVVALSHSGNGKEGEFIEGDENVTYELSKVDGIDVIVGGHSHSTTAIEKNGVQIIQPSNWGKELGLIDLKLKQKNGKWIVIDSDSKIERRSVTGTVYADGKTVIRKNKPAINDIKITKHPSLKKAHEATIKYINSGVGKTTNDINSFFSLVSDDSSVELVAKSQKWYVENLIKQGQTELQEYKDLPLLSAAAPFKAGGRGFEDPTYFVDIKSGDIKFKDLSNLYIYDNTLNVIKLNGAQVKEWLEMCSGAFNTIDLNNKNEQELLNENFRSYNFDTIEGLTYEIDVTKPAKYDEDGNIINKNSSRITNLKFNGKDLNLNQEFLIVTNNYRANGKFPGVRDAKVVYASAYENRQAIADYITNKGIIESSHDDNWKLKTIDSYVNAIFTSHENGKNYLSSHPYINKIASKGNSLAKYSYDLNYVESKIPQNNLTGEDRFETATKISKEGFDKSQNVVIVNSNAIADGLCATPFAKLKDAPILLSDENKLNDKTINEIKRLGAKNVYVIGGTNVINNSVVEDLKSLNLKVERINGNDRYETSLEIAKKLGDTKEVALVNGQRGLSDAISIASVAAEKNMPILLSNNNDDIKNINEFIKNENINKSYVIGGIDVISTDIQKQLPNPIRLGGKNRQETNGIIIDKFYKGNLKNIFVAKDGIKNENELVDALAVGVIASKEKAPVIIGGHYIDQKQEDVLKGKSVDKITKVGGNGNEGILNKIKAIFNK